MFFLLYIYIKEECRRKTLVEHFGETFASNCLNTCDNCQRRAGIPSDIIIQEDPDNLPKSKKTRDRKGEKEHSSSISRFISRKQAVGEVEWISSDEADTGRHMQLSSKVNSSADPKTENRVVTVDYDSGSDFDQLFAAPKESKERKAQARKTTKKVDSKSKKEKPESSLANSSSTQDISRMIKTMRSRRQKKSGNSVNDPIELD